MGRGGRKAANGSGHGAGCTRLRSNGVSWGGACGPRANGAVRLGAPQRWDSRLRRRWSAYVPEASGRPGELCRVLEPPEHWARHPGAVSVPGEADLGEGARGGCAAPASASCGVGTSGSRAAGISREAGCVPPAGRDHWSPKCWLDGRDCRGGPGTGGGLLRSGVGSEMEVCLGRNSQLLPA